ncbi:formylglycine-generating enzyme family protein [Pseudomonas sp. SDO528_S397]
MLHQGFVLLSVILFLSGCEAKSFSLPVSTTLSPEKVAVIAENIGKKYPGKSDELRNKILSTVVQSIDNMVFVEGGEFDMGDFGWICDYDEKDVCTWPCGQDPGTLCSISPESDNKFVHPVKLSSYYFSKFQTTLGDFDLFFTVQGKPILDAEFRDRENLKSRYNKNLPTPVKSWQEAKDYCQWIGLLSGYPVDLPTEAQWEFAARSRGLYVLFPTDNGSLNYGKNFPEPGGGRTFPVNSFTPNPLGIYNLSGNATDWVNDWYDKDYYQHSPVENPKGPMTGTEKVRRGSNYPEGPLFAAPVVRRWPDKPILASYYPGVSFRCAIQSSEQL